MRAPFFKVVGRMSSGYEKGRLLQAVVKKPGVSDDTLREVLRVEPRDRAATSCRSC